MGTERAVRKKTAARLELFAREYLVDFNGTRAAIAAGYAEKGAHVTASRLLRKPKVQELIQQLTDERTKKLDISAEYVLKTIKQTIERCSQGVEVLDREGKPTGVWKEDSFAVLKGCELLGKYLKLFTEKVEHSGAVGEYRIVTNVALPPRNE